MLLAALAGAPQDTAHLVVVATTDVHGRATAWDYVAAKPFAGGLTRVGTVVDSLRKQYPGQVLVLDAGDLLQGDPFAAYFASVAPRAQNPIIEAMNLVGYDAATIGNHDFNWGVPFLRKAVSAASFPYVSGNVYGLPADTLVYQPFVVLPRQGVRVGVAGFTTPGVMLWDRENVRGNTRVGPIGASAPRVLADLRRQSDFRIVLIHSGMDEGASYDTTGVGDENVAAMLAAGSARPDLVIVGHSHHEMRDSVIGGVHFVQPKFWAQAVSVVHVDLVRAGGGWRVARIRSELVPLAQVTPSPRIAQRLEPAQVEAQRWVAQPLGDAAGPMPAALGRAEATALANWINDVQRKRTGAQLSAASIFTPNAGFRTGPIKLGDVAAIYPYENTLRAVRLSGDALKAYLEQSARYYRTDSAGHVAINDSIAGYNFDIVGGATYEMDLRLPPGSRIRNLAVNGRAVAPSDTFTMAVNSYRQSGGGGYTMLHGAPVVYDRSENIRDLLAEDVRVRQTLDPAAFAAREWRIIPEEAAEEARALASGRPAPKVAPRGVPGDTILLRVLAINDFHGALMPQTYSWSKGRLVGGAAAVKALMDSAAAQCHGCPVLRLDAGDEMQGTLESNLFYGRSVIEAFNRMGIQAAAIGNHDFDWSVDTLRQRMAQSRYPWLSANIFDSTTGKRPAWATPYRILNAGPLRVAVIGWITPVTKTIVRAEYVRGLRFAAGAAAIQDVLAEVKAQQPDVTILLAHSGAFCDSLKCNGEILDLARELGPGAVDMIVSGHTHSLVNTAVGAVHVVQARSSGRSLAVIDLVRTPVGARDERSRVEDVYDDTVAPDSAIAALVATYAVRTDSLARRTVTTIKLPLLKAGEDEGQYPLGNLIADAQRNVARADVALMNNGGIRGAGLPAGPVSYRQLFELAPFQNNVVRVTVTGAVLRAAMEHALESGRPDAHISGMTVRYDPKRPAGKRVVEMRLSSGKPVNDKATYSLATLDFMQTGGSGYAMLIPLPVERGFGTDIEALLAYLRRLPQPVEAPAAPRIVPVASK
ncbi:MAG: 5'-nucleotidase C-terminal domain-containing protein [Gemmatimonadota bacterium]